MARQTLAISNSQAARVKIRKALEVKGWTITEKDTRPLVAACLKYVEQYQATHQLADGDLRWLKDFEHIFRTSGSKEEREKQLQEVKNRIVKCSGLTLLETIKSFIESGEISVKNISYGTWERFHSGEAITKKIFKIYCEILGEDWEDIAENFNSQVNFANDKIGENQQSLNPDTKRDASVLYYLPSSDYTRLIGREEKFAILLEYLSLKTLEEESAREQDKQNGNLISITGIGGVGKTSLALEAAYHCLRCSQESLDENYKYDAIIFISFQRQRITSNRIVNSSKRRGFNCIQILNRIARVFNRKELTKLDFSELREEIIDLLTDKKTLLVVDNLETVDDIDDVIFLLQELPISVKVVVTSRETMGFGIPLPIDVLSETSALELIESQAKQQGVTLNIEQSLLIYRKTCGIPLAIILTVGKLAIVGLHRFEYVINNLSGGSNDIVRYCFESSFSPLKGKSSYQLLTTLALFCKIPSEKYIIKIANFLEEDQIIERFVELQQLRLIQRFSEQYEILPIIRSYVLAELKNDCEWESELRNRWVKWYKEFVNLYGGQDEKEWNNYEQLEKEWDNISDVISWCINHNQYGDVKYFWQWIKGYSFIQGYQSDRLTVWNTRLYWTDWLLENAEKNQDYSTAREVLFDRAWTLTVMGEPEKMRQAVKLFRQAWRYRKPDNNPFFLISLALHIGYLRFRQYKIKKAKQWLDYAEKHLKNDQSNKDNSLIKFFKLNYYRGQIYFEAKKYILAAESFKRALELSEKMKHSRGISLSKRWLANVAIELNDFDDAEEIFEDNLKIAQDNKDRVGVAFCRQSLAFLEKARGDFSKAKEFGEKAIEDFQVLKIIREVEITKKLLNNLEKKE